MRNGYWCNPCSDCEEDNLEKIKLALSKRYSLPKEIQDEIYCRKCTYREVTELEMKRLQKEAERQISEWKLKYE